MDYFHACLPNIAPFYEWTMFHDDNNRWLLTDLDGVLCDYWKATKMNTTPPMSIF
ncbi:MAG: hypothetical protein SH850_29415 [Planctomycetaceae bacterium]|nr:hypothetical protein [Planctomycetaceae bacterium]